MPHLPDRLIVFTRVPVPGRVKTRLIPVLGAQGAADLQRRMTEQVLQRSRHAARVGRLALEVRYDGGDQEAMSALYGSDLIYREQGAEDLGERMHRAMADALAEGVGRVVLVGTDCPEIMPALLVQAFQALERHDLAIGPAADGGYYLIGLRRPSLALFTETPKLFAGIPWGTAAVLERTLAQATSASMSVSLLPTLTDIDRPEDLAVWERARANDGPTGGQSYLSVIIPTLNEEARLPATLSRVRSGRDVEIVVVDGGSRDGTCEAARSAGALVVSCAPGVARQMNAGVEAATGELLLFLHADTLLPEGFARCVRETLAESGTVAGAFRLGIDSPRWALRWIERLANWRSEVFHLPYGDQAVFLRRDVFLAAGGFPDLPIMSDFEFMRRLSRLGRIALVPGQVRTSARRWEALGVGRTTLVNQLVILAFHLGVSPDAISRLYHRRPLNPRSGPGRPSPPDPSCARGPWPSSGPSR